MSPLIEYIFNKSALNTYNLAEYYRVREQYASAITFYLESAETDYSSLNTYVCLIKAALCFEKQGDRIGTTFDLLYKAAALLPERPEAFFHLVRILNVFKKYHEAYLLCQVQLTKFTVEQIKIDCEYSGLHTILFEKAVAAWWIGYVEEAREIMYEIYKCNYTPQYTALAFNNLRSIGYPRSLNAYTPEKYSKLKRKFAGSKSITSYGQVMQDMFVLTVLNGKRNGTYLEIGSHEPIMFNNTYLLEKDFGWSGVSIDIDLKQINKFRVHRSNLAICADATTFNYDVLENEYDYLQVDCEPPNISYAVLEKIISNKKFKVITFEHDAYKEGDEFRKKSRELLSKDYVLTVADVSFDETGFFEDWWVHKSIYRDDLLGESGKTCSKYFYD